MAPGHMADGIRHGEHGQAEGERDPMQADAHFGKGRRQQGAAATSQHQPEGSDEFRQSFIR